jgi:hypothetical protein
MVQLGDRVRILPPFDQAFPGDYTVTEINQEDTWVRVDNEESAFDFVYVEVINGS